MYLEVEGLGVSLTADIAKRPSQCKSLVRSPAARQQTNRNKTRYDS